MAMGSRGGRGRIQKPEVTAAYTAVGKSIKSGALVRPRVCPRCKTMPINKAGEVEGIQFHHTHGYDKENQLVGEWVCPGCHGKCHSHSTVIYNADDFAKIEAKEAVSPPLVFDPTAYEAYVKRAIEEGLDSEAAVFMELGQLLQIEEAIDKGQATSIGIAAYKYISKKHATTVVFGKSQKIKYSESDLDKVDTRLNDVDLCNAKLSQEEERVFWQLRRKRRRAMLRRLMLEESAEKDLLLNDETNSDFLTIGLDRKRLGDFDHRAMRASAAPERKRRELEKKKQVELADRIRYAHLFSENAAGRGLLD